MSIAFLCVLFAALLPVLVVFISKADPHLDVHNPRDVHLTQTGLRKRAYGAHLNGLEAFPFFAVAVVTATMRGVQPSLLDAFAAGWVATRAVYTAVYLLDFARVRPAIWALSVALSVVIFLLPA